MLVIKVGIEGLVFTLTKPIKGRGSTMQISASEIIVSCEFVIVQ